MAKRLTDARSEQASERLRLIISRSPGGYTKNRDKWAKLLGVNPRSLERYLQRSGTNRRRIRSPEMKRKIDRAFRYRVKNYPDFIPFEIILGRGQMMNVTEFMVPTMGDGINPVLPVFLTERRYGGFEASVWLPGVRLPRVLIQAADSDAPRQGLAYGEVMIDFVRLTGQGGIEGELRRYSTGNDLSSSTFGDVGDPILGTKGNPRDLSINISQAIEDMIRLTGSSVVITRITFTPQEAINQQPNFPEAEEVGTTIRNRNPIVNRNPDGSFNNVEWNEVE